MRFRSPIAVSLLFALTLCSPTVLYGQGTDLGTIRGTVTDPSGALVAQAAVTVTDTSTGASRLTKTNGDGAYEMFGLRSGTYTVGVQAGGFADQKIDGVVVNGSSIVAVNVALRVSGAQQAVEVTANALAINTENPTIADTIDSASVIDLPRDSRDVYSFLYLNPNITQADAPGDFKFSGFQSYGASFSLDGQRSSGGIFGAQTASEPSLEAVDQVNVLSDNFSAEYAGIANIRITTKRGTNKFHGSMFYNNENSALAAMTVQDQIGKASFAPSPLQTRYPNPSFNINDLGGSLGGPVPKLGKTWFFMAYERDYNVAPVYIQGNKVAHPDLYTGNFTALDPSVLPDVPAGVTLTPQEQASDTYLGQGAQFTQIPSRLLNPTVQNLITKYFPRIGTAAPIDAFSGQIPGTYQTSLPGRDTLDLGTLRLDHDFSDNDHAYLAYNASVESTATTPVVVPYTGLGLTKNYRQNHTLNLSYTRVFRTNLVNEVRGGFNKENLIRHSNTTLDSFLSGIGYDSSDIAAYGSAVGSFALSTFGHPAISFSNDFATLGNGGRNTYRPLSQALATFGDTLTWVKGKHNFKFGGDAVRNWAIDGFALNRGNPRGLMTYKSPADCASGSCNDSPTDPFADFLLGLPPTTASFVLKARPAMTVHNWEQGYFAQDDWKLTTHVTLNLGLRWDLISPFIEENDLMANFDPKLVNPNTGQKGVFVIPSTRTIPFLDTRITDYGVLTAAQTHQGIGRGLIRPYYHDFAPRVGIAWGLGNKSVIRGGYGIFYPTSAAQGIRDPIATNPFNQGATYLSNTIPNGWPGFQHGISPMTGGSIKGFGNTPTANAVPVDLQDPRIHQYNVTFEREIGWNSVVRVSYLGTHMAGLIAGRDLNELPPGNNGFATSSGANTPDGSGDGVTPCDPINTGDCALSPADFARYPYPIIGENLLTYGNFAYGNSNAFQTEVERRYKSGLMLHLSYTYLDQKSTIGDTANSSLGSVPYNIFSPSSDYALDGFVSKNRFIAYGIYDLPVGRGRKWGQGFSRFADAVLGGWQTTFQMFAKSGTGYTPFWLCDDCDPVFPGNVGSSSMDAVGDFNFPTFRPNIAGRNFYTGQGGSGATIWNSQAFTVPSVGSDFFNGPAVAKRNTLVGPSLWGLNLGVHKNFRVTERVTASLGADFDNVLNHPLLGPDLNDGGGGGTFAMVGDFYLPDPVAGPAGQQPVLVPITSNTPPAGQSCPISGPNCYYEYNSSFGQLIKGYDQEGVTSRRQIRLRLRITF
ncbi:MAG TPA: carboxypeptidase-like regulatory domain-containing protein [Candidatus Sulfotelmatobacter sp.]|nr:carboxypeptidase-like regulatory domain-containing protein [Candidatus Sulfotelmatobacter sp.]